MKETGFAIARRHDGTYLITEHNCAILTVARVDVLRVFITINEHELAGITVGKDAAGAPATLQVPAVLINIARGSLVDEAALADAIRGNRLAGAALLLFDFSDSIKLE